MRIIVIVFSIVFSSFTVANNLMCDEGEIKNEYKINNFEITECNCNCTMQSNQFYLKNLNKKYLSYEFNDISKVTGNRDVHSKSKISPTIDYFIKNKKLCKTKEKFKDNMLYLLTLIPYNQSYCYELDGVIDSDVVHLFNKDIDMKIKSQIKVSKQYLYHDANKASQTKMYLIQNNEIEVLKEDKNWLYILYQGKKNIHAWIPVSAVK